MAMEKNGQLVNILKTYQSELLEGWLSGLLSRTVRRDTAAENEMRAQAARFIPMLIKAVEKSSSENIDAAAWDDVRQLLSDISQSRVRQGFSPIETAIFIFSLIEPLVSFLRSSL